MDVKQDKQTSMLNKWWAQSRSLYQRDPDVPPPLIEDC